MNEKVFISVDANEIGKKIERFILVGDLMALSEFSNNLTVSVEKIRNAIQLSNGCVFMAAGDSVLAEIAKVNLAYVLSTIEEINNSNEFQFSVGLGDSSATAYLAIKYAKTNGCFAICYHNSVFLDAGNIV